MKRLVVLLTVLFVSVLLSSCSGGGSLTAPDYSMDKWIDPAIQGKERDIIREEMKNVLPEHRKNFVFVDLNENVFVNRPELRNAVEFLRSTKQPGVYINTAGRKETFPLPAPKPEASAHERFDPQYTKADNYKGCPANRGPYRRMMTKEGCPAGGNCNGYTYGFMKAKVNVEGASTSTINVRDNETAYVTFNMWGIRTNEEPTNYPVVDGNLQYSMKNKDWALSLSYYSFATGRREALPANKMRVQDRFAPNQVITTSLYIAADNRIAMNGQGRMANRAGSDSITIELAVRAGFPRAGRPANGSGINMGHNIAIAQSNTSDYTRNGSYFKGTAILTTDLGYMRGAPGSSTATTHALNDKDRAVICLRPPDVFVPSRVTPGGVDINL